MQTPELIKPKGDFGEPICRHNAPVHIHLLETALGYSEIIIQPLSLSVYLYSDSFQLSQLNM